MRIDNEFKNLIPALTDEEYKGLEQSILSEGCRDALVRVGRYSCGRTQPLRDMHQARH